MPNWCMNSVYIGHDDPAAIDRMEEAYRAGRLLEEFVPVPAALKAEGATTRGGPDAAVYDKIREDNRAQFGYEDWWHYCVNEWGTKWDVGGAEANCIRGDEHNLVLGFDSAWAPPLAAFEKILALGYTIRCLYWEPGVCFAGIWDNGADDHYEYSDLDLKEIEEMIPEELDHEFNIVQSISDWQEQ